MKSQVFLPLVTYPDPSPDWVVHSTVQVADALGADVYATAFNVAIPDASNWFSRLVIDLPELIRTAQQESRRSGERLIALAKEAALAKKISLTTSAVTASIPFLAESAAVEARYFDIAIVGLEQNNPTARATAEAVVFGSGRPTLLLPMAPFEPMQHVAIAWDGSRVAARAVADAMPFLTRVSAVTVLTVVNEKPLADRNMAERLAERLRQKGLPAAARSVLAEDVPIGITLQEQARAAGAGLLIMGGYGHSAVREFILGGATEDILDDLRLPILCAH